MCEEMLKEKRAKHIGQFLKYNPKNWRNLWPEQKHFSSKLKIYQSIKNQSLPAQNYTKTYNILKYIYFFQKELVSH